MEKIINTLIKNSDNLMTAALILVFTYICGFVLIRILRGSLAVKGRLSGNKGKAVQASQMTRLKMIKRLILLAIYFIGISAALYQFEPFKKLGTALLASAGIFGVVAGIASRSSFANILSGITISFAQPFIIGDKITVGEDSGVVKEITLLYTILKSEKGIVYIPNAILAEAAVVNHTSK